MNSRRSRPAATVVAALSLPWIASHAGAQVVGPPVRIDPGGGTAAANETTASASEFNPNRIIAGWNDWRQSGGSEIIRSGFTVSFDGGQTWTDFLLRPPAANQSSVEGDPMSAYDDRTGTLWAGAISFTGNGGLYVARLNPGDSTFQPSVMARVTGGADKCWMCAGPRPSLPDTTRVYIAYNQGVIFSDDMGQTWSSPVALGSGIGFLPRVGPNGELYVAYWDFSFGMLLKRSLNGGLSFTTHTIATRMDTWGTQDGSRFPGNFRVPPMCYIAVDPNNGTLYAVYFDTTNILPNGRNVDLYFTKSTNQGTSWTTPVVINQDGNPPGDQFFPWIEVDESGRIHIVFFDSRHTNQNDNVTNGMFDAYYMFSENGGTSWTEIRLTPQSWNCNNDGLNRTQQFLGDYLGMAVAGDRAYPAYLDTTLGDPNVYTRVIEHGVTTDLADFDVFLGTHLGGGLAELESSDDTRLSARSEFGFSTQTANVMELRVGAVTSHQSPSLIDLTIEERMNQTGGTARVRLRDWATNQFAQVNQHPVSTTDQTIVIADVPAADHVRNDGRIEVSVRHTALVVFSAAGFRSFFDLVKVDVE
jgi:hypothetical protein